MHTNRIFLGSVFLLLLIVLFFPFRFPALSIDELPDPVGVVRVMRDAPLENVRGTSTKRFSGVVFRTGTDTNVLRDTQLELLVTDVISGRSVSTSDTFSEIYNQESRTVRFTFPDMGNTKPTEYRVALKMPQALAEEKLTIRGPIENPDNPKSIRIILEPLEKRSLFSILRTKVYTVPVDGEDIYYYWVRGGIVLDGGNPYECALDDTCMDHKNPGHFPFFYWLSAISQKAGLHDFVDWIAFWRPIFFLSYVATGVVLFWVLYIRRQYELALFALFFWLFNRWSLYVLRVAHVDFVALLFLVVSVVLFEKKRYWSIFLFSISLATKQVAIFLAPLYIILVWVQTEKEKRLKAVSISIAVMVLVPFLTTAPFLFDSPSSVAKGLLFSATRTSEANMGAAPLVSLLKLHGPIGVAPMAFLMVLIYAAVYRRQLSLSTAGLVIMLTFIACNTVLFNQYFLWFVPFLPLAASELKTRLK